MGDQVVGAMEMEELYDVDGWMVAMGEAAGKRERECVCVVLTG